VLRAACCVLWPAEEPSELEGPSGVLASTSCLCTSRHVYLNLMWDALCAVCCVMCAVLWPAEEPFELDGPCGVLAYLHLCTRHVHV
jgi:hypothetical protein